MPDHEIFLTILDFFNGKKFFFFAQMIIFAFETMLFLFFSTLCEWGGCVMKSVENSTLFLKPSLS